MKVVVDDKIPYIREAIEKIADEVVFLPGKDFTPQVVNDADALIIRTRTHCNEALLKDSKVQFIATATIGYDHIDTAYLKQKGIAWTNCPGCNAASVGQYLRSTLLLLKREKNLNLTTCTLGIVGVGHVGKEVLKVAEELGIRTLLCDPPRALAEGEESFVSLQQIAQQCNVITFHTPLTKEGEHATYHLANSHFFASLQQKPYLINSSRGEVVDNQALLQALEQGQIADAIIDVWENEPHLLLPLLYKVYIGTPHIAGYSADGKANATRMSLQALCRHFGKNVEFTITPPPLPADFQPSSEKEVLALQLYNPQNDSNLLKLHPEKFEELRGNYPLRREFCTQ